MTITDTQVRTYGHLIDDCELPSDSWIERVSPGTGQLVARFASGTVEDARAAVAAARIAFDEGPWPHISAAERFGVLLKTAEAIRTHAERLARIDAEEAGKPIKLLAGTSWARQTCLSSQLPSRTQTMAMRSPTSGPNVRRSYSANRSESPL